ncbi:MAG: hypothetical protein WBX11_04070 [Thiobacillaceae bacterium]
MKNEPKAEYLEKAKLLSKQDRERLLSRTRTKLARRLEDKQLSALEVLALQLENEDDDLQEWRKRMAEMRKRTKGK